MNAELVNYIEEHILPQYDMFADGHDRQHIEMVINESLYLARKYGAEENIAYTIASYHDLGMAQGRSKHHLTSAIILDKDNNLRQWFSSEQIRIMKEAIEDHRASAIEVPRTLYGCIIADADHFIVPEDILRRTVVYGKTIYPELSFDEQLERAYSYVNEKYSEKGYLHFHLGDERSMEGLDALRRLLKDKDRFQLVCTQYL